MLFETNEMGRQRAPGMQDRPIMILIEIMNV